MPCPKLARCRLDCRHRAFVLDYHRERLRQEIAAEDQTAEELAELSRRLVTFKAWLIGHKRLDRPDVRPTFGPPPIPECGRNSPYGELRAVEEDSGDAA